MYVMLTGNVKVAMVTVYVYLGHLLKHPMLLFTSHSSNMFLKARILHNTNTMNCFSNKQ